MLRQSLETLRVGTPGEGFTDLTGRLNAALASSGMEQGLLNLVCLHTSCSLTINENADPRVLRDLSCYLRALVPEEGIRPVSGRGELRPYVHADEGSDDMPAHIRTALTTSSAFRLRLAVFCSVLGRLFICGSIAEGAARGC
jgi:secondary thiamine-phosphate synthase enzyme